MLSQTHKAKPTPLQNLVSTVVHSFSVCTLSVPHLGTSKPSFLLALKAAICPHDMLQLSYDLDELQEAQRGENSSPSFSTVQTVGLSFAPYAAVGLSLCVSFPGGVPCSQSTFQRRQLLQKQCEMCSVPWLRSPCISLGLRCKFRGSCNHEDLIFAVCLHLLFKRALYLDIAASPQNFLCTANLLTGGVV